MKALMSENGEANHRRHSDASDQHNTVDEGVE
jgi:hypothetical protein